MFLHSFRHSLLPTDRPVLLRAHLYIAMRFLSAVSDTDPFPQSLTDAHIPRQIFLHMFFTLSVT